MGMALSGISPLISAAPATKPRMPAAPSTASGVMNQVAGGAGPLQTSAGLNPRSFPKGGIQSLGIDVIA
jgi:hypothetical protein